MWFRVKWLGYPDYPATDPDAWVRLSNTRMGTCTRSTRVVPDEYLGTSSFSKVPVPFPFVYIVLPCMFQPTKGVSFFASSQDSGHLSHHFRSFITLQQLMSSLRKCNEADSFLPSKAISVVFRMFFFLRWPHFLLQEAG